MSPTSASVLDAARGYYALGLHPIPVARDKRPIVPWKDYQDRQPTLEEIERWWFTNPDANVALVLGRGTFAVDADSEDAWAAVREHIPWDAPISKTAKGYHALLRGSVPDRVGALPGVDIRGVGYIVAPPSVHASGHTYRWVSSPDDARIWPVAPDSLLALIAKPSPAPPHSSRAGGSWLTEALSGAVEGGRDMTCTRLAGYFLGRGVPVEAVEALLQTWADRCTPPFPADQVSKCVESIAKREPLPLGPPAGISEVVDRAVTQVKHPVPGRATAIPGLDALLSGGFQPGELVYLGARPSVGKTLLAVQIARETAKRGAGVLVVTREMTPIALVRRMLAQESHVRALALKTGELADVEWTLLEAGAARLRALPIWVTGSAITVEQIAETAAEFDPGELGMIAVDYLQLVRPPADIRDKRAGVEHVSKGLKAIALQHEVPVLCLSSLSRPQRNPKNPEDWRPSLSDLRESGELEHDADVVLLMHHVENSRLRELIVAKNRDGVTGDVTLRLDDFLAFSEVA